MVVGVAVAVAAINACWATVVSACLPPVVVLAGADGCFLGIQRYKRRKDAVKAKLVALEEEDQARRTAQSKLFAETFSESEASALTGAFRNQIKAIRKREAEAQESRGETAVRFGWPAWGRRQMKD